MKIRIENRKTKFELVYDGDVFCYASVDCTDCTIYEPTIFDANWWSHKTNGPAVRYEVMVSLDWNICWVSGPFQCGSNPDLLIFQSNLKQRLDANEAVISDAVYNDTSCIYDCGIDSKLAQDYRARHESVFGRMKNWNAISHRFHHNLDKHSICFFSVAIIAQVEIDNSSPLFHLKNYV